MSTHPIPNVVGDPADSYRWQRKEDVRALCRVYLRDPENVTDDGTTLSLVFTPNLTAPQTAILNRLIVLSGILRITPQEWAAIESDIAGLATFEGLPTPTLAQAVLAIKAHSHILKALLRS